MPILTIAIPTYNRLEQLSQQMERIAQIQNEDVEILVSDNGSSDGTTDFLVNLPLEISNLRVFFNLTNMGFDFNIINLFKNATGDFVWFLSDDDLIDPTCVEDIIDALKCHPNLGVMALLLNGSSQECIKTHMVSYAGRGPYFELQKNTSIDVTGFQSLQTLAGTLISQISTCVISRIDTRDYSFEGGGIAHVILAHFSLVTKPTFLIFDTKAVSLGEKKQISTWFLDSCLNGVEKAYKDLELILGKTNCIQVVEATKTLGLKIAFSAIGSSKDAFDHSLLSTFKPPKELISRFHYTYWFLLIKISQRFRFFARIIHVVILSYQIFHQKIRLLLNLH